MTFYAAYDAYIPMVPSPLNPTASPQRQGRGGTGARSSGSNSGRYTPMSPSERLLRRKAAEAWRSETMHREAVKHDERVAVRAVVIKKVVCLLLSREGR